MSIMRCSLPASILGSCHVTLRLRVLPKTNEEVNDVGGNRSSEPK
jgi:hypothetical protein